MARAPEVPQIDRPSLFGAGTERRRVVEDRFIAEALGLGPQYLNLNDVIRGLCQKSDVSHFRCRHHPVSVTNHCARRACHVVGDSFMQLQRPT